MPGGEAAGGSMQQEPQITFHNMGRSAALEAKTLEKIAKLDSVFNGVVGCRVAFEARHKHHHQGTIYHVTINLSIPGIDVVVTSLPEENHAHEDPFVALRDAFDAARRQLATKTAKLRGDNHRGRAPTIGQERREEEGEIA